MENFSAFDKSVDARSSSHRNLLIMKDMSLRSFLLKGKKNFPENRKHIIVNMTKEFNSEFEVKQCFTLFFPGFPLVSHAFELHSTCSVLN